MPFSGFALFSLANAAAAHILAGFVLHLGPRRKTNRIFAGFCLLISWWSFAEFMFRLAADPASARFWGKAISLWPLVPAVLFHFFLELTSRMPRRRMLALILIYVPALTFAGIDLCTNLINLPPVHKYWGYTNQPNLDSGVWWAANAWGVDFPEFSTTSFIWLAGIITYAIWRFELFALDPALAAEKIIFTMEEPLFLLDSYGAVVHLNRAAEQLFRYSREDLANRFFSRLFPNEEAGAVAWNKIVLGQSLAHQDVGLRTRDGAEVAALISSSVLWDREGEIAGFVCVIKDITERRQSENKLKSLLEDLQRSNAELEQLAYVASHDLQEPLRMVSSYLELLERRYYIQLDADAHEFIGFAVDGARRMKQLIEDLLTFSRIGTKAKPFSAVNTGAVLDRALLNLKLALEEQRASVTQDPLPTLSGDESQLLRLFQNLLSNALKFHGAEPPRIHISAQNIAGGAVWKFSVRDNGIGIPPEHFPRIFQLFQRLHGRGEYPGSGIGLAVCKKIVERHHGQLWVESEPGQGSTFYFILPEAQ
jgi:PAS domain S-box-containing protein